MTACAHCPLHCPAIPRRKPPQLNRPPVVIGYSAVSERWHVIINPKDSKNLSYQFNCKKGETVEDAIRHAKVESGIRGIRWNRAYEERARNLAVNLGLVQQAPTTER